jgi:hypothetical protein
MSKAAKLQDQTWGKSLFAGKKEIILLPAQKG